MEDTEQIKTFSSIEEIEEYVEEFVFSGHILPPNELLKLEITVNLYNHLKSLDILSTSGYTVVYFTMYMPVHLTCPVLGSTLGRILWQTSG